MITAPMREKIKSDVLSVMVWVLLKKLREEKNQINTEAQSTILKVRA
jgi:hypothetical protein